MCRSFAGVAWAHTHARMHTCARQLYARVRVRRERHLSYRLSNWCAVCCVDLSLRPNLRPHIKILFHAVPPEIVSFARFYGARTHRTHKIVKLVPGWRVGGDMFFFYTAASRRSHSQTMLCVCVCVWTIYGYGNLSHARWRDRCAGAGAGAQRLWFRTAGSLIAP